MKCPACNGDTRVTNTGNAHHWHGLKSIAVALGKYLSIDTNHLVTRRRACITCGAAFSTVEVPQKGLIPLFKAYCSVHKLRFSLVPLEDRSAQKIMEPIGESNDEPDKDIRPGSLVDSDSDYE
jgi:hypothetical protein